MMKMRSSVLRGLWVAISLLLFISVTAPTIVEAKMDLPPLLNTEEDLARYMEMIKGELPEVIKGPRPLRQTANDDSALAAIVRREQALLRRLTGEPEYMRLVEQKPNLQTLEIRQVTVTPAQGPALNGWTEFLQERPWPRSEATSLAELKSTLRDLLGRSSVGFFAAIAQILPEKQKEELKNPDLRLRWTSLRRLISQTQNLRRLREVLRADAFGLSPGWTLPDLDHLIEDMADLEDRATFLVQALINPSARSQDSWLLDEDYVSSLEDFDLTAKELKFLEGLRNRSRKRFVDPHAIVDVERVDRLLRLREIPPYLAIYRGCVGKDCSTDSSWSFPYSPFERYWWIENADGVRLGYASGAITTLNHRPCLYIRDVTGPGLAIGDVTMIINGLFLGKNFYGTDQVTIMSTDFVQQNHFDYQKQELLQYPVAGRVTQTFGDQWIRDILLQNGASRQYDSIEHHSNARRANPQQGLQSLRVESLGVDSRRASDHGVFWMAVNEAARTGNTSRLQNFNPRANWRELIEILKNSEGLPVRDYYASVEDVFRRFDLPISRNLIRKHEQVFMLGHLNSEDAFANDKARKKSVRFLHDLIWRLNKKNEAGPFIEQNLVRLEGDSNWLHAIESLFERRGVEDVERILFLWNKGCRFRSLRLSDDAASWVVGFADSMSLMTWAIDSSSQNGQISEAMAEAIASRLENEDESIPEEISIWVANKYYEWPEFILKAPQNQEEARASLDSEENVKILMPLALAYVRDMPDDDPYVETAKKVVRDHIDDEDVPRRFNTAARRLLTENCENRLTAGKGRRNAS